MLNATHGPTTARHATAAAPIHPTLRHNETVRTSSTSGTITSTDSRMSSERESVASPTARPIHAARARFGRCQNRYARSIVSATVRIAIVSDRSMPSGAHTFG